MALMRSKSSSILPRVRLQPPVFDFLAPSWATTTTKHHHYHHHQRAPISTTPRHLSSPTNDSPPPSQPSPTEPKPPAPPLTPSQKAYLSSALRVNQAGELAATLIYAHQSPILNKTHPHLRPLMKHMYDQEASHKRTFDALVAKHRVRPTALTPVWTAAASVLGWSTAVMGREAAMACTEAVETEIGEHYNGQVRELLAWAKEREERGEVLPEDVLALVGEIRRIRDEELEHLDHAVENDAKEAEAYPVLTAVVRGGCKGAIWLSERV